MMLVPFLVLTLATICFSVLAYFYRHRFRWLLPLACLTVSGIFVLVPVGFLSVFGGICLFFSATWLAVRIVTQFDPAWFRKYPASVGILLALGTVFWSALGLRSQHDMNRAVSEVRYWEPEFWDGNSRIAYEATQALILNMPVHAEGNSTEENQATIATDNSPQSASDKIAETKSIDNNKSNPNWLPLVLARWFAILLALYVAYQTVVYFFHTTVDRFRLFGMGTRWAKETALVLGAGYVGRQIIRELKKKQFNVIAVDPKGDTSTTQWARNNGVVLIQADGTRADLLHDIPLRAISEFYVATGSDENNLAIALLLQKALELGLPSIDGGDRKQLGQPWFWQKPTPTTRVGYVRLYDQDLYELLSQSFASPSENATGTNNTKTLPPLELHAFNSDENAARQLVQHELSKKDIRPSNQNEVAQYVIVGFQEMGREVALALARLAHFENLRRARILILSNVADNDADPNVERFLARYPKFTTKARTHQPLGDVEFSAEFDEWQREPQLVDANLEAHDGASSPSTTPKDPSSRESSSISADNLNQPTPDSPNETGTESTTAESHSYIQSGVTFATNAHFSNLPPCPSSQCFLHKLHTLLMPKGDLVVKPAVIVCFENSHHAFAWAQRFWLSWTEYCFKNKLDKTTPHVPIFVWLPGEEASPSSLLPDHRDFGPLANITPFGLKNTCLSLESILQDRRKELAEAVQKSYEMAIAAMSKKVQKKAEVDNKENTPRFDEHFRRCSLRISIDSTKIPTCLQPITRTLNELSTVL